MSVEATGVEAPEAGVTDSCVLYKSNILTVQAEGTVL